MYRKRGSCISIPLILVLICLFPIVSDSAQKTNLTFNIIDKDTGQPVPARVLIKSAEGQSYYPPQAVQLKIASEVWFMSSGRTIIEIPQGTFTLRVERGKEYHRIKEVLKVTEITTEKTVVLRRWINMKARGYKSGENHLHRSPQDIAALCAAEDLDYGTVLQWWKGPRFEFQRNVKHVQEQKFGNITVPATIFDMENENEWGAFYVVNLKEPYVKPDDPGMPNLLIAANARKQGALICYQAGWSREVLIDALLGYVDVINICNNNFHMHRFQPRSFYSNLLAVSGFPVYKDTPTGMMQMNTDTYYRLLNCGLKLAAGAGSATGVKEVPVGYNRSYVRCKTDAGLEEFLHSWKSGKNFVTNGPMLFLRTPEGLMPGDSLHVSDKKINIELDISVHSDSPLQTAEIIVNGEIVKGFTMTKDQKQFAAHVSLDIQRSSWISARCTDRDELLKDTELAIYNGPAIKLNQKPSRLRFAHTSPIYIILDRKKVAVKESIREALQIIDAFTIFSQKNTGENYRGMILDAAKKAAQILEARSTP